MLAEIDNLIIEHLELIGAELTGMKDDLRDLKTRATRIEGGVASLKRDSAHTCGDIAEQHVRFDRLTECLERIEKRPELS